MRLPARALWLPPEVRALFHPGETPYEELQRELAEVIRYWTVQERLIGDVPWVEIVCQRCPEHAEDRFIDNGVASKTLLERYVQHVRHRHPEAFKHL